MEHLIATTLEQAGERTAVALWRHTCAQLASGLRIAVLGSDATSVEQLAHRIGPSAVPLVVSPGPLDTLSEVLLGTHAAVWATPATAALTASERAVLSELDALAPARRALVVMGLHTVGLVSDTPDVDTAQVIARVTTLCPASWPVTQQITPWCDALSDDASLSVRCRHDVAHRLLRDALDRTVQATQQLELATRRHTEELVHANAASQLNQQRTQATAKHVLSALIRHTDALINDLSESLYALSAALPQELSSVSDPERLRALVPEWLEQIVTTWLTDAQQQWERDLADDLRDIAHDEWLSVLQFVVPPPQVPALGPQTRWAHRLAVTGAIGGGAALAVAGVWLAGLGVAAAGALLALSHNLRSRTTVEGIHDAASEALRELSLRVHQQICEQLARLEERAKTVAAQATHDDAQRLQQAHDALARHRDEDAARCTELNRRRALLDERLADMESAS